MDKVNNRMDLFILWSFVKVHGSIPLSRGPLRIVDRIIYAPVTHLSWRTVPGDCALLLGGRAICDREEYSQIIVISAGCHFLDSPPLPSYNPSYSGVVSVS